MQVICPISGRAWMRDNIFMGENYADIHPIFRVPRSRLITPTLAHRFSESENEIECKLYFLAVMNCTELVQFKTIANPSTKTVNKHFYSLLQFAQWMDYASFSADRDISFPHYVVTKENADLENISAWIDALKEIRGDLLQKDANRERRFRLSQKNEEMRRELINASLKDKIFTTKVIHWLLEMCQLDEHPKADKFLSILTKQTKELFMVEQSDILEIDELLHDRLSINHPLAPTIFAKLRELETTRKQRETDFTILFEPESPISGGETVPRRTVEQAAKDAFLAQYGTLKQPQRKDFASAYEFYAADARYRLAMLAAQEKKEEKKADPVAEEVKEHFEELDGLQEEVATPIEDESNEDGENDAETV